MTAVNLQEPLTTIWGILPFPSRTVVPRWLMTSLSACMTGALLIPHHPHGWWWTKWLLTLPGLWSHVYKDPWWGCIEYPIVTVLLASKLQWLPAVWERYKLLPPLLLWSYKTLTKSFIRPFSGSHSLWLSLVRPRYKKVTGWGFFQDILICNTLPEITLFCTIQALLQTTDCMFLFFTCSPPQKPRSGMAFCTSAGPITDNI